MKKLVSVLSVLFVFTATLVSGFTLFSQAEEETLPLEINDFGTSDAGDNLVGDDAVGFLGAEPGVTILSSGEHKGVGSASAKMDIDADEFFDSDRGWGLGNEYVANMKTKNDNIQGQEYFVLHITTPSAADRKTAVDGLWMKLTPVSDNSWFNLNAAAAGHVQKMGDGDSAWANVPANSSSYVQLPFDWSGWVKIKISAFTVSDKVLGEKPLKSIELRLAKLDGKSAAVYLDSVYALAGQAALENGLSISGKPGASGGDSSGTTSSEPTGLKGTPRILNDFENIPAGTSLMDKGFWGLGDNVTAVASNLYTGLGSGSAELDADLRKSYGFAGMLQVGDGNIAGKDYFLIHFATPPEDALKVPNTTAYIFDFVPKAVKDDKGYWYKTNATVAGNIQIMGDNENSWKNVAGADSYAHLPFGWSGWIKLKISSFKSGTEVLGSDDTPISTVELHLGQLGQKYGKVYVDSLCVLAGEDTLLNGVSLEGKPGGGSNSSDTSANDGVSSEDSSGYDTDSDVTAGEEAPPTGRMAPYSMITLSIVSLSILMAAMVMIKTRKGAEKE